MRYPAAEKLEIIRRVEGSHLPVRRTLARIGVPPATFYRWCDRYCEHGPKASTTGRPSQAGSGTASPSRCGSAFKVIHRPRLLCDNGSSYVAGDLAHWLEGKGIAHSRGAPNHLQTQGKIERWHQTLKNRVLLENYFLPGQLEAAVGAFVEHDNHRRYHESLGNLTPADAYFGRGAAILEAREKIKTLTIRNRRLSHHGRAA